MNLETHIADVGGGDCVSPPEVGIKGTRSDGWDGKLRETEQKNRESRKKD